MDKLKPCPFCGQKNIRYSQDRQDKNTIVMCPKCYANIGYYKRGKEATLEAWNRRVNDADI